MYASHFTLNAEVGSRLKLWIPGNKHKYLIQAFPLIMEFFTFPCFTGFYSPLEFFLAISFRVFESYRVIYLWKKVRNTKGIYLYIVA